MSKVKTKTTSETRGFRLTRHFAITAIISIAIAAFALGGFYNSVARNQLVSNEQRHHAEVTRLFSNFIWPEFGAYLTEIDDSGVVNVVGGSKHKKLHNLILREIQGGRTLKIKIFNEDALTVYSSDQSQIGTNKRGYEGFELARKGKLTSSLSFRESFDTGTDDGVLTDLYVVSSYVLLADEAANGKNNAVIELYSDVTPLIAEIQSWRKWLMVVTTLIMLLLFCILLMNVRRADRIIQREATARLAAEENAEWRANHDALTSLPNRRYFKEILETKLVDIEAPLEELVLVYMDLDGFKLINDGMGHHAGDHVLKTIAKRISLTLPDGSIFARIGGDEFAILLTIAESDHTAQIEDHLEMLVKSVEKPIEIDARQCSVSVSLGVTICDRVNTNSEELLEEADLAMYQAKKSGRGQARFYSKQLGSSAVQKIHLEQDLRLALKNSVLEPHFQPRIDLQTNTVVGVEALARWPLPDGRFVPPTEFLPIAENCGLIAELDRQIMTRACEQIASLERDGFGKLDLSVNISSVNFEQDDLLGSIRSVLLSSSLEPERLQLELTESVLIEPCKSSMAILNGLHALGIGIALDDFGRGYSSIDYMKRLPLNILKIDRGFIEDVATSKQDASLLQAIVQLARSMQMKIVAEGVETVAQLNVVRGNDIQEAQGFYISHPLPPSELRQYLKSYRQVSEPHLSLVGGN